MRVYAAGVDEQPMYTTLIALAVCVARLTGAFVFLNDADTKAMLERKTVNCTWRHLEGNVTTYHSVLIPMAEIQNDIAAHVPHHDQSSLLTSLRLVSQPKGRSNRAMLPDRDSEGRPISTDEFNMTNMDSLVCVEYFIARGRVNFMLPAEESTEMALFSQMTTEQLESRYDVVIASASHEIVRAFGDKGLYNDWMVKYNYSAFIPKEYASPSDVSEFPCVVKLRTGTGGKGTFIVKSYAELANTIAKYKPSDYIITEAIASRFEISPNFVAYNGKLLGMMCAINHLGGELNIVGIDFYGTIGSPVDCEQVDKLAPVFAVMKSIVSSANYSGFGVANLRLVPIRTPVDQLQFSQLLIKSLSGDANLLTTTFDSSYNIAVVEKMGAVPKIFEINPRIGGPLLNYSKYSITQLQMIELYRDASLAHRAK